MNDNSQKERHNKINSDRHCHKYDKHEERVEFSLELKRFYEQIFQRFRSSKCIFYSYHKKILNGNYLNWFVLAVIVKLLKSGQLSIRAAKVLCTTQSKISKLFQIITFEKKCYHQIKWPFFLLPFDIRYSHQYEKYNLLYISLYLCESHVEKCRKCIFRSIGCKEGNQTCNTIQN